MVNIIIPVAGEGTRLRPHTDTVPKSLLYVAGKPILGHILDGLEELDKSSFVIVLGTKGDAVIDFCNKYTYDFKFVLQEKRLGLGHAIYMGAQGLQGPCLILLGDTIIDVDYQNFCAGHANVLALKEIQDPRGFGVVELSGDEVVGLEEKPKRPKSNMVIVGLYYFQDIKKVSEAIEYVMRKGIKVKNEYQLTDALNYMLQRGEKFKGVKVEYWYDCGTAAALIDTNRHLLKKTHYYRKRANCVVIPPVFIDDSADISEAIIGPNVSVGKEVKVKGSIVRDSIINNGAQVENALLVESIVGSNASVRSGYKKVSVSDSSIVEFP